MNILERKTLLESMNSVNNILNTNYITGDIKRYLNSFIRPSIYYYIPNDAINTLYNISCDAKLSNTPLKRFNLQNEVLDKYGFKPLASGTSRRTFYSIYDPNIIIKLGSDLIGRSDNLSENIIQELLLPFCPKILDVDPTGSVMLAERVETMTEKEYKEVWINEIFDLVESLYQLGYLFEDVGLYSFKNWGVRIGFGPVILDFPYLYQIDWDKMICDKEDPITHKKCGGKIGYNYEEVMSEIICYKCKSRYSAKYLSKPITGKTLESILGRNKKMKKSYDIPVIVVKGNKVVFNPSAPNTVAQQSSTTMQELNIIPANPIKSENIQQQEQPVTAVPNQYEQQFNPQQPVPSYYNNISQQPNFPFYNPQQFNPNQCPPIYPTVPNQFYQAKQQAQSSDAKKVLFNIVPEKSSPVEEKKPIIYPKPMKNDIIRFLRKLENDYSTETALFIADLLSIKYIPKAELETESRKPSNNEIAVPFPDNKQQVTSTNTQQSQYATINTMVNPNRVETVIAPPTTQPALKVEDPNHWNNLKTNINHEPSPVVAVEENKPTTGLEIVKPMTAEEIEAQEAKNRQEKGILGFPGTPLVDSTRFKEAIPRIKAMVEQRFNNFVLLSDSEQQSFQLARDITRFIEDDLMALNHDNGKGILVIATRTTDTHNKDCYNIKVTNYGSVVFSTVLYPEEKVDQTNPIPNNPPLNQEAVVEDDKDDFFISVQELTQVFSDACKKFDVSKYSSVAEAKHNLIEFLYKEAVKIYRGNLPVPRALKEATAYVNQVVTFSDKKKEEARQVPKQNTVAHAL